MEWDYKIRPDSDHVAKFQGDRWRDLGERVAKKRRYICGKNINSFGRPNYAGLVAYFLDHPV